jgi:hypothetical protein
MEPTTHTRAGAGQTTYNERTGTVSTGSQFIEQEFGDPEDAVMKRFSSESNEDDDESCVECGGRLRNYDGGDRCIYCQDHARN